MAARQVSYFIPALNLHLAHSSDSHSIKGLIQRRQVRRFSYGDEVEWLGINAADLMRGVEGQPVAAHTPWPHHLNVFMMVSECEK